MRDFTPNLPESAGFRSRPIENQKSKILRNAEAVLCALAEGVIAENQSGHGLNHGHGAREDAGIVAAAGLQLGFFAADGDGRLRTEDGCGGLEANAEEDRLPLSNAALDTAGAISLSAHAAFFHIEEIVVFGAFLLSSGESAADFE